MHDDPPGPPKSKQNLALWFPPRSRISAPFVQYRKSEVSGEFLDSKNLEAMSGAIVVYNNQDLPEEKVLSASNVKVS